MPDQGEPPVILEITGGLIILFAILS